MQMRAGTDTNQMHTEEVHVTTNTQQHTRLWHLTHVSLFPQECAGEEDVQAVR